MFKKGYNKPTTIEAILARCKDTIGGCIEFHGNRNNKNYGQVSLRGKRIGAHRAIWILKHGPLTRDQHVLHICDNPPCVNIDHLKLGSHKENMHDMCSKGRHMNGRRTECYNGHAFTPENTMYRGGKRRCRICWRAWRNAFERAKRQKNRLINNQRGE